MNSTPRKTIAIILSMFVLGLMYFGSYLPLKKSQFYIQAMIAFQSGKIKSVKNLTDAFNLAFNYYSPIGQDEIVSYYTGGILANLINQQTNQQVIEILVKDVEKYTEPIVKTGKGFGFSQNLYNFAKIYQLAAQKLQNIEYLQKSVDLFYKGLENSPNREIFLEGLFIDYQIAGNKARAKEVGEIILKYWPEKEEIKKAITENQ